MKDYILQTKMPDQTISRQDIFEIVRESDPTFREGQMKRLLAYMIKTSKIEHVGRNKYRKFKESTSITKYENRYSEIALKLIAIMQNEFPLIEFRIWELSWLNEFVEQPFNRNYIFLEIENGSCELVFERIISEHEGKVLFKPDQKQIQRYGTSNSIIIDRLITEAPRSQKEPYNLTLEKLIVDLFANKKLRGMLAPEDYPKTLEAIFSLYAVDQVKMFRYARRRNKDKELQDFLERQTNVELKVN